MTAAILSALAPLWKEIAAGAVAILSALALYFKGRSDAKAKAELKDVTNANEIRRDGAQARDDARARDAGERLRDDDGWRRD